MSAVPRKITLLLEALTLIPHVWLYGPVAKLQLGNGIDSAKFRAPPATAERRQGTHGKIFLHYGGLNPTKMRRDRKSWLWSYPFGGFVRYWVLAMRKPSSAISSLPYSIHCFRLRGDGTATNSASAKCWWLRGNAIRAQQLRWSVGIVPPW
ncbi:hypothetical protein F5Y06DRAFT_6775 [Hypoxylon sp. FL0890]|nr:hypothetical protein F5Y06DRAFT_6775 [Hypoxylon sp. FL0890]